MEQAWKAGAGLVVSVNKWDLVEKDERTADRFTREIRQRAPFLQWVPFIFTSALTGQRVRKALDLVLEVQDERHRRIDTNEVNDVLRNLVGRQPPPHARGRAVKLRYATQVDTAPPTIIVFANLPKDVPDHYIRYLHNGFRKAWGFLGTPLRIFIRNSSSS
jgi:GTP-binding protein